MTLVEVSPDVDDEDQGEKDDPTGESTGAAGEGVSVKEETDEERPKDLREPVEEIVEGAGTDVEQSVVVSIEF